MRGVDPATDGINTNHFAVQADDPRQEFRQLTCAATQFQHAIARSDRQLTYQHFAGRELVLA